MTPVAPRRGRIAGAAPPLADALLAGVFVAGTVAEALVSDAVRSPLLHLLLALPAMVLLAWRRRVPILTAAIVMGSNIAINPDGELTTLLALVLVSFTVGSELGPPRSWLGLATIVVPFLVAMAWEGLEPSDVAAALVFLGGPWSVGSGDAATHGHAPRRGGRRGRPAWSSERDAEIAAVTAQRTHRGSPASCTTSSRTASASLPSRPRRSAAAFVPTRSPKLPTSAKSRTPPARRWPRCAGYSACCAPMAQRLLALQPGLDQLPRLATAHTLRRACPSSCARKETPSPCLRGSTLPPTGWCRSR